MPAFDLRGILVAKYSLTPEKQAVYTGITSIGDAMDVNLDFRFAEGRLYAESTLAEYVRKCVGGTISIAVKYIPTDAQKMMYGTKEKERSITYTPAATTEQPSPSETTKKVKSLVTGGRDRASYCGVTFYAPDMIDAMKNSRRSLSTDPCLEIRVWLLRRQGKISSLILPPLPESSSMTTRLSRICWKPQFLTRKRRQLHGRKPC